MKNSIHTIKHSLGAGKSRQEVQALSGTMTTCDLNGALPVPTFSNPADSTINDSGAGTGREIIRAFPLARRQYGASGNSASRRRAISLDTEHYSDITKIKVGYHKKNNKFAVYQRRQETNQRICFLLNEVGGSKALKWKGLSSRCGKFFLAQACSLGHVRSYRPMYNCNFRLCPWCSHLRQERAKNRLLPRIHVYLSNHSEVRYKAMATFTIEHSDQCLKDQIVFLFLCFNKLKRQRCFKSLCKGGVISCEFTLDKHGKWHPHLHVLMLNSHYWPQSELVSKWREVTNDRGCIVDIRQIKIVEELCDEVLKYVCKPADIFRWTGIQMAEFLDLGRINLLRSFGCLRDRTLDQDVATDDDGTLIEEKCNCGMAIDDYSNLIESELTDLLDDQCDPRKKAFILLRNRARSSLYRIPKFNEEMQILNPDTGEMRRIIGEGNSKNFIVTDKDSGLQLSAEEIATCELFEI